MSPAFPVIWFGDRNCVTHYKNEQELSTTVLMPWGALTFEYGTIIDIKGQQWKLAVKKKEKLSLSKLLKMMFGKRLKAKVSYEYTPYRNLTIDEIKSKLITYSENDPGDVMWQFIEHEDIVKGVQRSRNLVELFQFVEQEICEE